MVPHGRSLCSEGTVGQLVGDHLLRVQLLHACGCLRFRRPRCALCSRVPQGALPSSLHARYQCLGPAHDHACSCACGCAGRDATMQLPTAKTAMRTRRESRPPGPHFFLRPFTFISHLTCHNKHTHEDTYGEDIQRFQWRSPWLQWRSQRLTTTTAGSSPRIT